VNELELSGYSSKSSSSSLNSIAATLSRIERKLDLMGTTQPAAKDDSAIKLSGDPYRVFYGAYTGGNYPLAVQALKRFMQINHDVNLHLDMASYLVAAYEPSSVSIARQILEQNFDSLKTSTLSIALDSLYRFYAAALTINDEYPYLRNYVDKALQRQNPDKEKAALLNVCANLEYEMKNDLKALEYQKQALELDPSEPAYIYNVATLYERLQMDDELNKSWNMLIVVSKNRLLKRETINAKYLDYAKNYFAKKNMNNQLNEIEEILIQQQQMSPTTTS
jgi:tetratricopeptide (TPR) repeat protein